MRVSCMRDVITPSGIKVESPVDNRISKPYISVCGLQVDLSCTVRGTVTIFTLPLGSFKRRLTDIPSGIYIELAYYEKNGDGEKPEPLTIEFWKFDSKSDDILFNMATLPDLHSASTQVMIPYQT